MTDRTAYNKMQADIRRNRADTLRRFQESNPEAYQRLLKKAQSEVQAEFSMSPLERLHAQRPVQTTARATSPAVDWDKVLFKTGERHYNILTNDGHLYFEGGPVNATLAQLLPALQRHPSFSGSVNMIAQCRCVSCSRRDREENTPYDYTTTDQLLKLYGKH